MDSDSFGAAHRALPEEPHRSAQRSDINLIYLSFYIILDSSGISGWPAISF
jgi:hypothetical protein